MLAVYGNVPYNIGMIILFILIAFLPGIIGGRFMPGDWYAGLVKPPFNPPGWIFGPVWTLLYPTMGISSWLVWKKSGFAKAGPALSVYALQLILNGAWSWIFFGLHRPGWAFAELTILWAAILATVILFWKISTPAGALLLPYLAWVSFAAALNAAIWRLNAG